MSFVRLVNYSRYISYLLPKTFASRTISIASRSLSSNSDSRQPPKDENESEKHDLCKSIMDTLHNVESKFVQPSSESFVFQVKPYRLHRLTEGPSCEIVCTRDEALDLCHRMLRIRQMESMVNTLYTKRFVRGFCHLCIGQEAICVGVEKAITKKDRLITSYRGHGYLLERGETMANILSELGGRKMGCSRGKGGSMHMYSENFYGGNGIVGAQFPLGAGLAFAQKYLNTDEISIAVCGDGATNQGQIYETYNMAKLWKLPIIFLVENNGYAMTTSMERSTCGHDLYTKGDVIPGIWLDGMDVLAVRSAFEFLAKKCRNGEGPFIVEASTYRYKGHSVSDPGVGYRTREEINEVRRKSDPIDMMKKRILDAKFATEKQLKRIISDVKAEVNDALKEAMNDTELTEDHLYNDVFVSCLQPHIRGITPFTKHTHSNTGKIQNL